MEPLRCEGLKKAFNGIQALTDVTLQFPTYALTAIIGPNGAGKTTLLDVFTGFTDPDAGKCFVGMRDTSHLSPYRIARLGVARTFQNLRLILQVSVLENVMLARPNQRGETLWAALSRFRVSKEEKNNREASMSLLRSVALEGKANELAGELSYGQQKMLSLAACRATEAPILLLDEPVSGVHTEMATRILDLLTEMKNEGRLVVFVEHDIAAVRRIADHLIVMDHGKIIAEGAPTDVLQRPEIMEAYVA